MTSNVAKSFKVEGYALATRKMKEGFEEEPAPHEARLPPGQQLEIELLVAENRQLRAQLALLTHEKEVALSMWREQRKRNKEAACKEEGQLPITHHQEEGLPRAKRVRVDAGEEDASEDWLDELRPVIMQDARAEIEVGESESGQTDNKQKKNEANSGRDDADSQPLVSKRERRRELFPLQQHQRHQQQQQKRQQPQQLLSLSPFPNNAKLAQIKRRQMEDDESTSTSSSVSNRRIGKLPESRLAMTTTPPIIMGKRALTTAVVSHVAQTSPDSKQSPSTSMIGAVDSEIGEESPTGPKEYLCRDCRRPFCRRGDRDNHEQLCGHTKWRTGKTCTLGFVALD